MQKTAEHIYVKIILATRNPELSLCAPGRAGSWSGRTGTPGRAASWSVASAQDGANIRTSADEKACERGKVERRQIVVGKCC